MIIVQVPLRVSFLGGGTDFPEFFSKEGGCVLSTAINKYIYVIVKPRVDSKIRLTYTKAELVSKSGQLKHDIARECLKYLGISHGIEIVTIGDLPSGTGLGSSSAVTVGILKALYTFIGEETDAKQLAEEACYIERKVLKKPIGVQDQYIAAYGGFRLFEFSEKGITSRKMAIGGLFDNLLMFYTGITRDSSSVLETQSANTNNNLPALREMRDLVYKADWLDDSNFGQLLDENWKLKKTLGPISSPKIDKWYEKAISAGAIGGKILGAGGGGFLLFYCPIDKKDKVRNALRLTEIPIAFEPDGAKVVLNYRT